MLSNLPNVTQPEVMKYDGNPDLPGSKAHSLMTWYFFLSSTYLLTKIWEFELHKYIGNYWKKSVTIFNMERVLKNRTIFQKKYMKEN